MLYPKESMSREIKSLDGFWHFCADKANIGEQNGWECGVFGEDTREAAVPASYNEQFNDLYNFHGKAWYSKEVFIPLSYAGKAIYLRFGNVAGKAKVWVNGCEVGGHVGTALPFECEISAVAKLGQKNLIVVQADSTLDIWSLPPAAANITEGSVGFFGSYPPVAYDFFPYGGIQRSVFLYTCPKTRIEDITIRTELLESTARVVFDVELTDSAQGELVATTDGKDLVISVIGDKVHGEFMIESPRL